MYFWWFCNFDNMLQFSVIQNPCCSNYILQSTNQKTKDLLNAEPSLAFIKLQLRKEVHKDEATINSSQLIQPSRRGNPPENRTTHSHALFLVGVARASWCAYRHALQTYRYHYKPTTTKLRIIISDPPDQTIDKLKQKAIGTTSLQRPSAHKRLIPSHLHSFIPACNQFSIKSTEYVQTTILHIRARNRL